MTRHAIEWQNRSYQSLQSSGGVVNVAVCEKAVDTHECHAMTLAAAIGTDAPEIIMNMTPVEIDEATFHGPQFDLQRRKLRHNGTIMDQKGRSFDAPHYDDIGEVFGGSFEPPELWSLGGFAFAFCDPPYPLSMDPSETQACYLAITSEIAPPGACRILSWQQEAILPAARWLELGSDWWGVYVFSIYNRKTGQMFGVAASTTD